MKNEDDDDRKRESTRTPDTDGKADAPESPSPKRPKTEFGAAAAANDNTIDAAKRGSSMTRATSTKRDCGQGGGRVRLPEKLLKYLNDEPMPDVIWWMPDGNGFAYNIETVQEKFLDTCFQGTKLSSFVRSLNRWGFRRVFYAALPEQVIAFYHPKFKKEYPERVKEISMTPLTKSPQGDDEGPVPQDLGETSDPTVFFEAPQVLQSSSSPPPPQPQLHSQGLLSMAQSMGQGLAAPGIGQVLATGAALQMPQQLEIQALPAGQSQHDAVAALIQGQLLSLAMMQQQQQPQLHVQLSGAPVHQQDQAAVPLPPPQLQLIFPGVQQGQIPLQMQLSPQVLQLLQQPQLLPQAHQQLRVLLNAQGQPHVMVQQLHHQQQQPHVLTAQQHPHVLPHQSQSTQHPQQQTNQAAVHQPHQSHALQQLQQLGISEQLQLPQAHSALQQLQVSQGSQQLRIPQQVTTQSAQPPATIHQVQQGQLPQLNLAQLAGLVGQPPLVIPNLSLQGNSLQTAIQHFAQQGLAQAWLQQQQQQLQQGTVIQSHDQADYGQENKADRD